MVNQAIVGIGEIGCSVVEVLESSGRVSSDFLYVGGGPEGARRFLPERISSLSSSPAFIRGAFLEAERALAPRLRSASGLTIIADLGSSTGRALTPAVAALSASASALCAVVITPFAFESPSRFQAGIAISHLRRAGALIILVDRDDVFEDLWTSPHEEVLRVVAARLSEAVESLLLPTPGRDTGDPGFGVMTVKEVAEGEAGEMVVAKVARCLNSMLGTTEAQSSLLHVSVNSSRSTGDFLIMAEQAQHTLNPGSQMKYSVSSRQKGVLACALALLAECPPSYQFDPLTGVIEDLSIDDEPDIALSGVLSSLDQVEY